MRRASVIAVAASFAFLSVSCASRSDIPPPVADAAGRMILVRGGAMKMGDRYGDRDETTVRDISVSDFWLARTETTAAEVAAWRTSQGKTAGPKAGAQLPATDVSWRDAVAYCNYLSAEAGLSRVYSSVDGEVTADWKADGYRLPTEAEFEWAASGGVWSRGYDYSGSSKAVDVAWFNGNADEPRPVASKRPNELGLFDLSGNVWEWCWDTYGEYDRRAAKEDPRGPDWGEWKVLRGGSWKFNAEDLRPSNRYYADAGERLGDAGFRVARRFTEAEAALYPETSAPALAAAPRSAAAAKDPRFADVPPADSPYRNAGLSADERARDLLSRMSLEEKAGQMVQGAVANLSSPSDVAKYGLGSVLSGGGMGPSGNYAAAWADMIDALQRSALSTRLGIPIVYGLDAVHGHNNVRGATIFPHNIGLGAANDPALVERIGRAVAEELRATGAYWDFAPCVAVARDERWGRTYESYSEDPARTARLGAAFIAGLQADGSVAACAKHYLADGGTTGGTDRGDARISDEELRSVHLPPYEAAVDAGVKTVMASFSAVNGERMHANPRLLEGVLRGELGFRGVVVSDWNAHKELPGKTPEQVLSCVRGGIDMFMAPEGFAEVRDVLVDLTRKSKIPQERIDASVLRILTLKFSLGLFERPFADRAALASFGGPEHRALARQAVRESLVVLKNDRGVLPIGKSTKRVLVAGSRADDLGSQCGGWTITWQGGSGAVTVGTTILAGIADAAEKRGISVDFVSDGEPPPADEGAGPDLAVVVVGEAPYAEWFGDRRDLRLGKQDRETVARVAETGLPVVLVLVSGRPLIMTDEFAASDAAVAAWLPGTEGAGVADVLFGEAAPTGTLGFSWPAEASQLPINAGDGKTPLFPLGFSVPYGVAPTR